MKLVEHPLTIEKHCFLMNNQRSMYWEKQRMLIIADLHLGKSAHFRKNGFAVPSFTHQTDLDRLSRLITYYKVDRVVVVGDFIHAKSNKEVIDFLAFTQKHSLVKFVLIKGNHDRLSDTFLYSIGINEISTDLVCDGVLFIHEPPITSTEQITISGHYHPGVQLQLLKNKYKRLPCFVVDNQQIILPAFSTFTGLDSTKEYENPTYYAFYDNGFVRV